MAPLPRPLRTVTRLVDGHIRAYQPAAGATGLLSPALTCRPTADDDVVEHAVTADLRRVYYTTLDAAVRVTADGAEVWRSEFAPRSRERYGHRPGCALSLDERVLWIYRPDAIAGRDRPDQWVALDADTGGVLAQADLGTVGHGGEQLPHPAGESMLLDVGEGQDGSAIYRASLVDGRLDLVRYPWHDRILIDLSPDGRRFMTVDHQQTDLAVHTYPDGEVTSSLAVDAFGHDPGEVFVDWYGGFLNQDTVIAALTGETEDEEEWFCLYRVDARTGEPRGEFHAHAKAAHDVHPLGDGTWLTTAPSGHPIRHADPPTAPGRPA
ncbi:hypothetical protein [Streptomyces profundus]|uniref:hypothetical protein n=1 Tax=Streptomyces profundus TaxID=2867410 RepID=UPI001D16B635|nr:hypothetical protein [Streptomyces sp. MA3_2.13]UED84682.1 hypothetical protein K4G22_11075 [Streptomyces sp. MA3_2.13]